MGSSFCQCNNYANKNIIGTMKKSDISLVDTKQKTINNNNLLKLEDRNPENNTNINTNNKIIESNDGISKINKSSKEYLNIINKSSEDNYNKSSKNEIIVENSINNEEEMEEENDEEISNQLKTKELRDLFDDLMISYAEYIVDEVFEKANKPEIIEIEKKLKSINQDNNKIKELINGKLLDRPALLFKKNNEIYKGMWNINGEKEGFGIFIDKEGNKYIGGWKEDKFNGYGRLISMNGDYYEGEWMNGIIQGNGKYYNKKEEYTYIGEFKENKFNGKGKITYYKSNMKYEGNFEKGFKEGKGKLIFEDGSYYEGIFKSNNYEEGKFKFKDGRHYRGKWLNNNMDGEGKFVWEKNLYYKGEYKNNMKNGKGVYYFGEKNKIEGIWKNGLPHGEGVIAYENKKIEGEFRYGKVIKGQIFQEEISSPKKNRKHKYSLNNENYKFQTSKINKKEASKSDKNIRKK